jgi:transposase
MTTVTLASKWEWTKANTAVHRSSPSIARYLRDVMLVLPHWPKDRYSEFAPTYSMATRERLDPQQLDAELGPLTTTQG